MQHLIQVNYVNTIRPGAVRLCTAFSGKEQNICPQGHKNEGEFIYEKKYKGSKNWKNSNNACVHRVPAGIFYLYGTDL